MGLDLYVFEIKEREMMWTLRRKGVFRRAASAAALVVTAVGAAHAQVTFVQIPTFDTNGSQIVPMSINASGTVTGYYRDFQYTTAGGATGYPTGWIGTASGSSSTLSLMYPAGHEGDASYLPGGSNYNGDLSWGLDMNSSGTVAGAVRDQVMQHTSAGTATLGNLNGFTNTTYAAAFAAGINDNGYFVGGSQAGSNNLHAIVSVPPAGQNTGTSGLVDISGGQISAAYAISQDASTIVGFRSTSASTGFNAARTGKVATVWNYDSGSSSWLPTALGSLKSGGQSVAYGLNNSGLIVGVSDVASGAPEAFVRLTNGTMIALPSTAGAAGGGTTTTLPSPINFNWNTTTAAYDPLTYYGTSGVNSCADAINNNGQIVGFMWVGSSKHAFVATLDSNNVPTVVDLNSLLPSADQGWTLSEATSINDSGQIVGYGLLGGVETGFELTLPSVPGPSSVALISCACVVATTRRRR